MLAKVVPGSRINTVNNIQWPSANHSGDRGDAQTAETFSSSGEVSELEAQVASLKAELQRVSGDAERRIQEALTQGRQEGSEEARQALGNQLESELAKIRQMMQELSATGPRIRHQAEEDLVRLAVAIARRILHREITVDIDAMTGLVKAAFAKLETREIQQVRTDPDNFELVQRVIHGTGAPKSIKILPDPTLRAGSLIVDTVRGHLDASVETQLEEIQRGFIDIVSHS